MDPHTTCLGHSNSCFLDHSYNPTNCEPCQALIEGFKAGDKLSTGLFNERLKSMRRSIKRAIDNDKCLSEEVIKRFNESGGKDIFLPSAAHLDPRETGSPTPLHTEASVVPPEANPVLEQAPEPAPSNADLLLLGVPGPSASHGLVPLPVHNSSGSTRSEQESEPHVSDSSSSSSSSSTSSETRRERHRRKKRKTSKRKRSSRKYFSTPENQRPTKFSKKQAPDSVDNTLTTNARINSLETMIASLSQKMDSFLNPPEYPEENNYESHKTAYTPYDANETYDPNHPDYDTSSFLELPSHAPAEPPLQAAPEPANDNFYYFPESCQLFDDSIVLGEHQIFVDSRELEYAQHNGQDTFRPLILTEAVKALIQESSLVVMRKDLKDSKQEHFKSLAKVVNTNSYAHLGLRTSDSQGMTITTNRVSRFLESVKSTYDPTSLQSHKPTPFSLVSSTCADPKCELLGFASAPKLGKDCHKLSGLLAGKSSEVPDNLRIEDYEIRQILSGLLLLHETTKFSSNIATDVIFKRLAKDHTTELVESHVKSMQRINNNCAIPVLQSLITNVVHRAQRIRYKLREKAVSNIKTQSIKTTLKEGCCFSLGLFDDNAIRKAEDCCRSAPPAVHIHTSFPRPFPPRGRGMPAFQQSQTRADQAFFRERVRSAYGASHQPQNFRGLPRGRGKPKGPSRGNFYSGASGAPQSAVRGTSRPGPRGRGSAPHREPYQQ